LLSQCSLQVLHALLHVKTTEPQRSKLGKIWKYFIPVKLEERWLKCLCRNEGQSLALEVKVYMSDILLHFNA